MLHQKIIIAGGGPVGLTLALYLARQNKEVMVIDQKFDYHQDGRVLALSYASMQVLARVNGWLSTKISPIRCVQISHAGLGISNIKAESVGLPELGYTIAYSDLCEHLLNRVRSHTSIQLLNAKINSVNDSSSYALVDCVDLEGNSLTYTSELLIMAEGGKLLASDKKRIEHDYQQKAVIAKIRVKAPVGDVAFERFTGIGPLVLLPHDNYYVVVWALDNELAEKVLIDNDLFIKMLDEHYTTRLGGASLSGSISSFPLKLTQAQTRLKKRLILLGNSAQTVHPISAQGLNLGLRDVATLAHLLEANQEINPDNIQRFDEFRSNDANSVIGFTHFLASFVEKSGRLFQD
jgi:2-octaprenyl-6-methoxyphenol hydroxylase